MREIKFRVYRGSELIGYERINSNGHWEQMRENRQSWLLGCITSEDDLIREQFTGKLDRNGVDIYEGDKDKHYVIMWSEKHALFCQHFYQDFFKRWSEASYPMDVSRIEITGNIHQITP